MLLGSESGHLLSRCQHPICFTPVGCDMHTELQQLDNVVSTLTWDPQWDPVSGPPGPSRAARGPSRRPTQAAGRPVRHQWTAINRHGSVRPNMTGRMVSFSAIDPRRRICCQLRCAAAAAAAAAAAVSSQRNTAGLIFRRPRRPPAGCICLIGVGCGLFFEPLTGLALTRLAITGGGRRPGVGGGVQTSTADHHPQWNRPPAAPPPQHRWSMVRLWGLWWKRGRSWRYTKERSYKHSLSLVFGWALITFQSSIPQLVIERTAR